MNTHPIRLCLAHCALLWFPLLSSSAVEVENYPPINPALLYWTASALQRPLNQEQIAELGKMANGQIPPDEAKINLNSNAEALLRQAAHSNVPCDWGLQVEKGPDVILVYCDRILLMAKTLQAEAELRFTQHRVAEAQDLLLTEHRIARHIAAGPFITSWFVGTVQDDLATRAAARHCLDWDEATRRDYAARLKALPPMPALPPKYFSDQGILTDWLERLALSTGPDHREQLERGLAKLFSKPLDPKDDPVGWSEATWKQELAKFRTLQDKTAAALAKPWKEEQAETGALLASVQTDESSLYRKNFEAVTLVADRNFTSATLRTMLDVALRYGAAITEADAANDHDAFEGEPLRLKKAEDGALSLVAAEQHPKGKEVELKLGK